MENKILFVWENGNNFRIIYFNGHDFKMATFANIVGMSDFIMGIDCKHLNTREEFNAKYQELTTTY